jgi:predicted dehydrogenase
VEEDIKIGKNDTLLEEVKAFINSVITRKPPLVSGEDGRRALEVAQMIQESIVSSMQKTVSRGSAVFYCLLSTAYGLLYL